MNDTVFVPRTDVHEDADQYTIRLDLPGADPKDIAVEFARGALSVRASVSRRTGTPLLQEYEVGDFHRSFNVTDSIDADKIGAEFHDGVLTLTLPKSESAKPRRIEVRSA